MTCQQPRVEFGGIDGGGFEARRKYAPCGLDSLSSEGPCRRSRRRALGCKLRGLMLGGQRIDQFTQRFA